MNKSLFTVYTFARINTRRFFRDKLAIFFVIVFPLIFLFVFGSLNSGTSNTSFRVAIINQSDTSFAKQFTQKSKDSSILKVDKDIDTLPKAKEKMVQSQLDAAIILPSDFGTINPSTHIPNGKAKIVYTQNSAQSANALASVIEAQFKGINSQLVKTETPFSVTREELKQKSLTAFDYTFAGLLGFAIIGMGIFGPVNVFPELKKMGILRRLSTTPLKVWQYFLSTMIGQAIIGLLALAIMFAVAILVFHLKLVGGWTTYIELTFFLVYSIIMILGIGLALGGWAQNERQAAPLTNAIVFPMMFLSGTFFPRFLMPEWLQTISALLPLTPVIDGIRLIGTEGRTLIEIWPQVGLIGIWMIVIYAIAFKVFRWE
ncbi:ABC transporter permease [Candidatus Saccharibacteria bacterium]|nr:ABC transporter permease [Candidatus Saccharibacteria bacterium]